MPPRLSLRRVFLCVLCCGGAVFLIISIHQRWPWSPTPSPPLRTIEAHLHMPMSWAEISPTDPTREPRRKAWYFSGGTEFPTSSKGISNLFPDQSDGDRVADQLMYVPQTYEGNFLSCSSLASNHVFFQVSMGLKKWFWLIMAWGRGDKNRAPLLSMGVPWVVALWRRIRAKLPMRTRFCTKITLPIRASLDPLSKYGFCTFWNARTIRSWLNMPMSSIGRQLIEGTAIWWLRTKDGPTTIHG